MKNGKRVTRATAAREDETEDVKAPASKSKKRFDKAAFVERLLVEMARRLEESDIKPSLGDFLRLMQLEKELKDEIPSSIEVTWVEPKWKKDQ